MGKAFSVIKKLLLYLEQVLWNISMFSIMIILFLTTADVSRRFIANRPITGAVELQVEILFVIVMLGLAAGQRKGVHVGIDVLQYFLKGRLLHAVNFFNLFIVFILFCLVTISGLKYFLNVLEIGASTITLGLPKAPFIFTIPFGSILLCLRVIVQLKREAYIVLNLRRTKNA